VAYRLALEVEALWRDGITWHRAMAEVLTERDVPMPWGAARTSHTTVGRLPSHIGKRPLPSAEPAYPPVRRGRVFHRGIYERPRSR
jgi:hypothetical protein